MRTHEKARLLLLAQCDTVNGEEAGEALQALYDAGAMNVQILSTVTKKNRPGTLFLIDADEGCVEAVETCLVKSLGVTGWHRIPSVHRYIDVEVEERTFRVSAGGEAFDFAAKRKISSQDPELVRPEHESVAALRAELAERGFDLSFPLLRQKLAAAFLAEEENPIIHIK